MKHLRKIALSGLALAATAATLGSTTFAWYTTNATVSATGMTASMKSEGASSIFISKDGSTNWGQSITFASTENAFKNASLVPVEYKTVSSEDIFTTMGGDKGTVTSGTDTLKFDVYVKTSATGGTEPIDLYLKKCVVTTDGLTTADNLLQGKTVAEGSTEKGTYGISTTGDGTATYRIDATRALAMVTTGNWDTPAAEEGGSPTSHTVTGVYDLANCGEKKASTGAAASEGVDALKYYNKVMNKSEAKSGAVKAQTTFSTSSSYKIATLDPSGANVTKITFEVFLDGWDAYCFDACKGASFSLSLSFTTDTEGTNENIVLS